MVHLSALRSRRSWRFSSARPPALLARAPQFLRPQLRRHGAVVSPRSWAAKRENREDLGKVLELSEFKGEGHDSRAQEMHRLSRSRRWEEALCVFEEAGDDRPRRLWTAALVACGRAGQYPAALRLFYEMPTRSVQAYNVMINLCGRQLRTFEAVNLFDEMVKESLQPNIATYTSMVSAHSMAGDTARALETFHASAEAGITPDATLYVAALSACGRSGRFAEARELLERMRREGVRAHIGHYTNLLLACVVNADLVAAGEVVTDLRLRGIKMDVVAHTALIQCHCAAGDVAGALAAVDRMRREDELRPSRFAYKSLLNAAAVAGDDSLVERLTEEIRSRFMEDQVGLEAWLGLRARGLLRHGGAPARSAAEAAVAAPQRGDVQLPPGWSSALDSASGRRYYWEFRDPSGTTTWHEPSQPPH